MEEVNQSVKLLTKTTQEDFLYLMAEVLCVPYGTDKKKDIEKVKRMVESCVRRKHLSVLEHLNITLKCVTNIGTYKGYTRHRHCAFTIESTSFVNYKDFVYIPSFKYSDNEKKALEQLFDCYKTTTKKFSRDFIPQCKAAVMIMTTNVRELRYILGLRADPNDNPSTIELRNLILEVLNNNYPFFFPLDGEESKMSIQKQY